MKTIKLGLATALAAFLIGTVASLAATIVAYPTNLFESRSRGAAILTPVSPGDVLSVQSCDGTWCQVTVRGLTGWIDAGAVANDQPVPQPQPLPQPQPQPVPLPQPQPWPLPQPQPWPQPLPHPQPQPQPPIYDDEVGACFYSERNYGGSSFCLEEGDSYNRLRNWDNRIRSVQVFGGAYVDLCADRNLNGACVTVTSNTRRLPSQLDRRASSLEVY